MDPSAPSFSLLTSSDSQGLNPSDSLLSLPSEPPEIGKWFSSYVYESPELNIGEDLECVESVRGNDCEKEGNDVKEENGKWKEEKSGEFVKDEKEDHLVGDANLDSKGFVRCKNAAGNSNLFSQVSGLPDSLVLSSEPPDIRNWFSSYAYESPVLGPSDNIDFSDCKEDIFDIEGCVTEKVTRAKKDSTGRNDDFACEQIISGIDKKNKRSLKTNENEYAHKGNHVVHRDQASAAPTEVHFKSTGELNLKGKEAKDHDNTSTKVSEFSCLNIENPTEKQNKESSRVAKSSVHNDELSPKIFVHHRDSEAKFQPNISGQREIDTIEEDDDSSKKASRSRNKENDGNYAATNCFVSTRRSLSRRENEENYLTNIVGDRSRKLHNGARVSKAGHEDVMVQRKVLQETTNIRRSDAMEVTGKWKCPQKSKPNLGPPLKQLRLERWVRRDPLALGMAKRAIDEGVGTDMASALALEEDCYEHLLNAKDISERLAAFAEKGKPIYRGE